jgi:hypothetical protein
MQSGLALASLGGGAVFLVVASILTGWHHRPAPAGPVTPPADDLVWLACHNIACAAHMATPHTPDDQGTAKCTRCGQIRSDHQ